LAKHSLREAPAPPELDARVAAAWAAALASLGAGEEKSDAELQRTRDLLTSPLPSVREQDKPRRRRVSRRRGLRLLSDDEIEQGKARYREMLNADRRRWRFQQAAAKEIAAFLGLPETSWQTVEDRIIVPVLQGLKAQRTPRTKK